VTWATSVPILVILGLSVLDLGPMYATDRRQTASSLNAPAWAGHNKRGAKHSVLELCALKVFSVFCFFCLGCSGLVVSRRIAVQVTA